MVLAQRSTPLVSVVMAVWNDPRWLRVAIDSILDQSLRELELVVVDDGSTDETVDILADAERRDPRVRLLRVPHTGAAAALNAGIEAARADFIARLDADDWSHPRRLERQLVLLRSRAEIGVVGSDVE